MKRISFKSIGLLFLLSGFVTQSYPQTSIPAGAVSGTWTPEGSPYHIQGDLTVPSNQVLTIKPGVTVVFDGHYKIWTSYADIIAVGKPDSMILFTMADTNGLVAGGEDQGGWNGLRFAYSSTSGDTSRLEYCIFEYCKVHYNVLGARGIIGTERIPRLSVANCEFRYNYSDIIGVDCRLADVVIRNNNFHHNRGDNIISTSQANPYFHDNQIRDNTFLSIFYISSWTFPVIERNTIYGNKTETVLWAEGQKAAPVFRSNKVLNNEITNASRYVLYLNNSEARIDNNLIANNLGRTVYCNQGNNSLTNNTIVNNDNAGGYLLYLSSEKGVFNGNIFWGNSAPIYYFKRATEPAFKFNLIQGGTGGFAGNPFTGPDIENFDANPQFIDPTVVAGLGDDAETADFGLNLSSPAINRGDPVLTEENFTTLDVYGGERIKYGIIDAGAAENLVKNRNLSGTISSELYLFGDSVSVTGDVLINDDVIMTIAGGTRVVFNGPYQIEVKGTLIADGRQDDQILFTISDTTGYHQFDQQDGSWRGIYINNGTGNMDDNVPSLFKHCVFEYGKTNSYGRGGLLTLISINNVKFEHCAFRYAAADNYYGATLWADNATADFDHCSFSHNFDEVNYLYNSDGHFSGCTFADNTGEKGKCIYMSGSRYWSTNNLYHNNYSGYYDEGTVITANNSELYLLNDVIVNNTCGNNGNINLSSCFGSIVNSTIANNHTTNSNFAAAIGLTRTELGIYNTILYGNTASNFHRSIFLAEENTDPDLYHCIVEGGQAGVHTYEGFSFTGQFQACFDEKPEFIDPTAGSGNDYDATMTNWQLLDISPCINRGSPDTNGLALRPVDFTGNPRILNGQIDIGAFEKQGSPAELTSQPEGGNLCTGDGHSLTVGYTQTDTVKIQWKKDGATLNGASTATLEIDSATLEDEGNYTCFLENSFGIVNSIPIFLSVKAAPKILVEPDLDWVEPKKPLSLEVLVEGSAPMFYQWQKDGSPLPEGQFPEFRFVPADISQEGDYRCITKNICGADTTSPVTLYLAPQICMVTVEPETGKNLVIWEKNTTAPILAYNVYRESTAAGIYDKLAEVAYDELSVFTDSTADPTVQAYLYKITAIEENGEETDADLCRTHKTIHLLVSTNPELNTTQLSWDRYYGFEYQTYSIFRSSTGVNFDSIHSLASSLNSWTDPAPSGGDLFYRLSVQRPEPCFPTGGSKKAGTGPYKHSLSNLDDNSLKATFSNAPDSILLSNLSIAEEGMPGALVGRLTAHDPDSGDLHTYYLVPGTGAEGNGSFTIAGDLLLAAVKFDYETQDTYTIRVRARDQGENYMEDSFTITILDVDETVGIHGTLSTDLKVYPNPMNNSATIEFPNPGNKAFRLRIMDLTGKIVQMTDNIHENRVTLYRADLGRGVYILELQGDRTYRTRLVIE